MTSHTAPQLSAPSINQSIINSFTCKYDIIAKSKAAAMKLDSKAQRALKPTHSKNNTNKQQRKRKPHKHKT